METFNFQLSTFNFQLSTFNFQLSTQSMYLNTHTYYSLRYGTLAPEELPVLAKKYGVDTLVLSDINNTCLLYTSDAADERSSVDLGGRRIIKKKNNITIDQHCQNK